MCSLRTASVFSLLENINWKLFKNKGVHVTRLETLKLLSKEPHLSDKDYAYQAKLDALRTVNLCNEQQVVKDLVLKKEDNVFYTGAAGTGKSILLRSIISDLRKKYGKSSVAVTAMTGIAAINIGGQTLHSFAGFTPQSSLMNIESLHKHLNRSRRIVKRWMKIKALVIDEVSMLDAELFDRLNHVVKNIRCDTRPFGGLQLIITGDFCQLPPVNKVLNYCFEAESWNSLNHAIQLTTVHRQSEQEFIKMLNEIRFGTMSEKTIETINNLDKAPEYKNDGIDVSSEDWEPKNYGQLRSLIKGCLAPLKLPLKINAQVMLTKNFTKQLVNGSKGVVVGWFSIPSMKFYDEHDEVPSDDVTFVLPVVKFTNGQIKIIPWTEWTLRDETDHVVARRIQIPLILSWAISIHKSQGQTLERVKVDLNKVFERGQTYVALSRATSLNSLQVLNFSRDKVITEERVKIFYDLLTKFSGNDVS
ncbi:15322_t:CDS:10 [Funneliformis geosporum]|uniref:ATP-dependent DNA helicase n=1 Tax=Funneliformis geosporum TaxID=1117311 RepID=A0A9W4SEA2_9GLOM|nr:15322_t:CDS:10 [Funneliformis geosporum]CAI2165395.1 7299_t:CDS:10 [Funneliformis geosporum]